MRDLCYVWAPAQDNYSPIIYSIVLLNLTHKRKGDHKALLLAFNGGRLLTSTYCKKLIHQFFFHGGHFLEKNDKLKLCTIYYEGLKIVISLVMTDNK